MLDPKTVALVTPHDVAALQAILPLVTRHKTWLCERLGEDPAETIANIAFELAYLHDLQNKTVPMVNPDFEEGFDREANLKKLKRNTVKCCDTYYRTGQHSPYCHTRPRSQQSH